jgi:hypothetical protein
MDLDASILRVKKSTYPKMFVEMEFCCAFAQSDTMDDNIIINNDLSVVFKDMVFFVGLKGERG